MAMLDGLPGIEVTIQVDGVALKEYEDTDDEQPDKTVTRFVEAATGKEFTIHVKYDKNFQAVGNSLALAFYVDSDKNIADGVLLPEKHLKRGGSFVCRGFDNYVTTTRFQFCELETVSDGIKLNTEASKVKNLGLLRVDVHDAQSDRNKQQVQSSGNDTKPSEVGIVSEKALKGKALSHSVGTSTSFKSNVKSVCGWTGVGHNGGLIGTFDFRYRSREALRSMLIIPRTPTPPPLEERDFDTLTREELKELHRRAKEAKEQEDTKRKIKRERKDENPRPRKVSRPSNGDTQLEIDDDGSFRESSTATLEREEPEIIELD